jgi:hypothetical protein
MNGTEHHTNSDRRSKHPCQPSVTLRKFPYPYQAALAISSDIDGTSSTDEFLEIQRFLNTQQVTSMGPGIGLEIAANFFMYDTKRSFSYFTHSEQARQVIIDLIHAGYIDAIHTYGDAACHRDQILRALDDLYQQDCRVDVWINHYGSPSNFSHKFEHALGIRSEGDVPRAAAYHADRTVPYGIRFTWVGAHTRLIGQAARQSALWSVFDERYPWCSARQLLRELLKTCAGRWNHERYTLHSRNQLMQILSLADGQQVYEFIRYCNHPAGVSQGATSRGLSYAISKHALGHLKTVEGMSIVYTHLGQNRDCQQVIASETQAALQNLAQEYWDGNIYITTTARLLRFYHATQYLVWSSQHNDRQTRITVEYLDDPIFGQLQPSAQQLQGLTFYVTDSQCTDVYLQGNRLEWLQRNPADQSGSESITIPFIPLNFPYN